jgi:hypothetical protein
MERKKPAARKPPAPKAKAAVKAKANSRAKSDSHAKPDPHELAKLAFDLYQRRGEGHGHDLEDWLLAEQMLQNDKKRR